MKLSHLMVAAATTYSLASSLWAATSIYVSGAPAVRQPLTSAIEALVDAGGGSPTRAYNGSNIVTANVVSWENASVGGASVNIYLTYNGSAGGYQAVSGSKTVRFLSTGLSGPNQTDVLTLTSATPVVDAVPDFSIADEYQISTPWIGTTNYAYGPNDSTYVSLVDRINGILPLRVVASPAAPSNLNITPQLVNTLYANGSIRLSQLTGLSADFNKKVYVLSRGIDSGARVIWATNNGFGALTSIIGYLPTVTLSGTKPVVAAVLTSGGSGYTSTPTVSISSGGGTGATAHAVLTGDKVTSVVIDNGGSGYTSSPSVNFTLGGGKLAAATAVISNGTANSQVPYPAGNVIGVDYEEGNGGYPKFGDLLTALTSTLALPGGNPGDIYLTVLAEADWQVAKAAGAKEVSWNGNKLGDLGTYGNSAGVNTPTSTGSSSPALSNGQYELWGYTRLVYKSSLAGDKLTAVNAINTSLKTTYAPVLLKDVNVKRGAPDGGPIQQGQISAP